MSEVVIPEVMAKELGPVKDTPLAQTLAHGFVELFAEAEKWAGEAAKIVVTDVAQKTEIKRARELRLTFRRIRCDAENKRKTLKEDIVRQGRAIDGMANVIKALTEPLEKHLQAQEDFAERMEAERKAKLAHERAAELAEYVTDVTPYALGDMTPESYSALLAGLKYAHHQKVEAERIAREEAAAKAKAEAEERERIRLENERLKAEAIERERMAKIEREKAEAELRKQQEQARKEREAIEAKAKAEREAAEIIAKAEREKARKEREDAEIKARSEREAREKIEREIAEQRKREELERARIAAEEKKKAAAPDKEKLKALADAVRSIAVPSFTTNDGIEAGAKAKAYIDRLAIAIEEIAKSL